MAKFNIGDKLVLTPIYMDGRFNRSPFDYPDRLTVILTDDNNKLYTMVPVNKGKVFTFTYQYADSSYRLATAQEIEDLFHE